MDFRLFLSCLIASSSLIGGSAFAGPLQIPLVSYFPQASTQVTHQNNQPLPKSIAAMGSNWNTGGAFISGANGLYQGGQPYSKDALVVLPPNLKGDFAKVDFFRPTLTDLDRTFQWNLTATYGMEYFPGNTTLGVNVQIVVAGDPMDASDSSWQVIDSFNVTQGTYLSHSTPLGTWPLRNHFHVAIQVTILGSNNWYDNLVVDKLALQPSVPRPAFGIAQSNMTWESNPYSIISSMAQMGTGWLRTNMRTIEEAQDFAGIVMSANGAGMQVVVNVLQDKEDFVDPAKSTANAGSDFNQLCGWSSGSLKFSQVNVNLYSKRLEANLKALKSAGASVAAFEIGNELDWVCFNGDIRLGRKGIMASSMSAFIQKYAKVLVATRNLMNKYYPESKLLTFGMANCNQFTSTSCVQDPINFIINLKSLNAFQIVDGIGEHLYTSSSEISQARSLLVSHSAVIGVSKPFWITEWGYKNATGQVRYAEFRSFAEFMNSTGNIPLGPLFLYTYSDGSAYSLLNGSLDPAARIIQQYNSAIFD